MINPPHVTPAAAAEIARWAMLEVAPWQGFAIDPADLAAALRAEAEARVSVFLLRIADGIVTLDDKSAGYAAVASGHHGAALVHRAGQYLAFLQNVVQRFGITGRGVIAIELEDLGRSRFPVPVFAFQKRRGASTMLMPDVDFPSHDFFVAARAEDPQPFDDKLDAAIFVGSTTGNPCLTSADVRAMRNQRLRSALFFRERRNVTFELPVIVQVDTSETRALIENLGVGGRQWPWTEQIGYKFLISMDGNGATCSRVIMGLLGNNVLLKYNSPYLLYYFHGLEPWRHYIPIIDDHNVIDLLDTAGEHAAFHQDIAARSRSFALDYLSEDAVSLYVATMLRTYLRLFGE